MEKFVILTTQRTGSTLLVRSLDQNKDILLSGEVFMLGKGIHHSENHFPFLTFKNIPKRMNYALNYPRLALKYKPFLKAYYRRAEASGFRAAGFKLMLSQLKFLPGFVAFFKKENIKPIVLTRRDVAGLALSVLLARTTGTYHQEKEDKNNERQKIQIAQEVILERLDDARDCNQRLEVLCKKFDSCLSVDYDDFYDWDNTIGKICDYLGVKFARVGQALEKINTARQYENIIANYGELKALLEKEGYQI